jgi:di/tricarboxylate transporter
MPYEAALLLGLLCLLAVVVALDVIRADVAAMIALLGLAGLQQIPGVTAFVDVEQLFYGFSSRTVIALIGVMIISEALVRCGFINSIADVLLRLAQGSRSHLASGLFFVIAAISMIIQNAGAAAMAVPLVSRVANKMGLEKRQLLMPVGRMILTGGCCTLIGSSPLLMLNDLLSAESKGFGLLAPLPVGLALVISALVFSIWQFRRSQSLPIKTGPGRDIQLRANYQLGDATRCYRWSGGANGFRTVSEFEDCYSVRVVATYSDQLQPSPPRNFTLPPLGYIALVGGDLELNEFESRNGLGPTQECAPLRHALSADYSGLIELLLTPGSSLVGQSIRDLRLRHHLGLTPLAIYRADGLVEGDIRAQILQPGDSLLAHISWRELEQIQSSEDYLVLAHDKPESMVAAGLGIRTAGILGLVAAYGVLVQPGVAFLMFAAAVSLVAAGVLGPDRAYHAISWRTIFMLACLMPFSNAITASGASDWLAGGILALLGADPSGIVALLFFAVLAAALGQLVSNVAATVILVPVAIQVAHMGGFDASGLVLLVAISVSNAFLLPTNPVSALIASAGNYQSKDFFRSGIPLTFIFCVVSVLVIALMYPSYLN